MPLPCSAHEKSIEFRKYCLLRGIHLKPWQIEASESFLKASYPPGKPNGASGKSFLIKLLSNFVNGG